MSGEANVGPNSASGRMKVATCDYDEQTGDIEFMFMNATKDVVKVNLGQFPQNIVHIASLRGIMETVRDTYAGSKGDVARAMQSANERIAQLMTGEWGKSREGAGEGQGALWIEAVARIKGWSVSDARQKLFADTVSDAQRKDIKETPQVKRVVAEIRLEKAKAAVEAAAGEAAGSADALAAFGA